MIKSKYLQLLQQFKMKPNFWCSDEYFSKAKLQEHQDGDWIYIWDDEVQVTVLPPLNIHMGAVPIRNDGSWAGKFWSDFPGYYPGAGYEPELLDLEYIYDPKSFLAMAGNLWAVFRKNSRKFPRRYEGQLRYVQSSFIEGQLENLIIDLFSEWMDGRNVHDAEVLFEYALNGDNRKLLLDEQSNLLGINAWDENWSMINFRLCITRPREPFLNEYMRLLFYTDETIISEGKLVNDGGVLDSESLKNFKDKLNPVMVRQVKTWTKRC